MDSWIELHGGPMSSCTHTNHLQDHIVQKASFINCSVRCKEKICSHSLCAVFQTVDFDNEWWLHERTNTI